LALISVPLFSLGLRPGEFEKRLREMHSTCPFLNTPLTWSPWPLGLETLPIDLRAFRKSTASFSRAGSLPCWNSVLHPFPGNSSGTFTSFTSCLGSPNSSAAKAIPFATSPVVSPNSPPLPISATNSTRLDLNFSLRARCPSV